VNTFKEDDLVMLSEEGLKIHKPTLHGRPRSIDWEKVKFRVNSIQGDLVNVSRERDSGSIEYKTFHYRFLKKVGVSV